MILNLAAKDIRKQRCLRWRVRSTPTFLGVGQQAPPHLTTGKTESSHNSPIYDEYQTQSAKVWALPQERAHQDYPTINSNSTPQPI